MAATTGTLTMRGLQTGRSYVLNVYNTASSAVGTYILTDWNSPAAATSPNFFSVPEPVQCTDFIPTAATGMVEFTSDGMRTAVVLDYAAYGATNQGRPVSQLPKLQPGKMYRLLVTVILAA
jgi:hypothetical protein